VFHWNMYSTIYGGSIMIRKEDALNYHSQGRKGKIEVVPT